MTRTPAVRGTPPDKTVAALVVATLIGLYFCLWRVLEGSWTGMLERVTGVVIPMAAYLALIAGIGIVAARRGADLKRWWFLLLLPECGALAGVAARLVEAGPGTMVQAAVTGACYGAMHALLLRWSWHNAKRRARSAAA